MSHHHHVMAMLFEISPVVRFRRFGSIVSLKPASIEISARPGPSSRPSVPGMFSRRENLGLLLAFVGVVLFGGTLPAPRLAVQFLDPCFVTFPPPAPPASPPLPSLLS